MRRSLDDYLELADSERKRDREEGGVNSVSIDTFDNVPSMPRGGADILGTEGLTETPRVGLEPTTTRLTDEGSAGRTRENSVEHGELDAKTERTTPGLDGLTSGGVSEACQPDPSNEGAKSEESPPKHGYRLLYYPDPCLSFKAIEVLEWTPNHDIIVEALRSILRKHKGLGLAATQISASDAIAVMKIGGDVTDLVNPVVVERIGPLDTLNEGSLSIPGFHIRTPRHREVEIVYQNTLLDHRSARLHGVEARCAQHLVDQLAGITIVTNASRQIRRQCERIGTKARGWS